MAPSPVLPPRSLRRPPRAKRRRLGGLGYGVFTGRSLPCSLPSAPVPPSVIPRRREPRPNRLPSAGGDAQAQRSAGEEKRPPATTPVTPIPPSFPRKRESRNPRHPNPSVIPAQAGTHVAIVTDSSCENDPSLPILPPMPRRPALSASPGVNGTKWHEMARFFR